MEVGLWAHYYLLSESSLNPHHFLADCCPPHFAAWVGWGLGSQCEYLPHRQLTLIWASYSKEKNEVRLKCPASISTHQIFCLLEPEVLGGSSQWCLNQNWLPARQAPFLIPISLVLNFNLLKGGLGLGATSKCLGFTLVSVLTPGRG